MTAENWGGFNLPVAFISEQRLQRVGS